MATIISKSPEETFAIGEQWGREAGPGCLIGLAGDLGAGKTQLVKGLTLGLSVRDRVHSPTFALVNEYGGGRLPLFHLDLYRLETNEQIIGAGLDCYLAKTDGVTVIEWIDHWFGSAQEFARGAGRVVRYVRFDIAGEKERQITYEDPGV